MCVNKWKFASEDSACSLDQQNELPMEGICFQKIHLKPKKAYLCTGCKSFSFLKYSLIYKLKFWLLGLFPAGLIPVRSFPR